MQRPLCKFASVRHSIVRKAITKLGCAFAAANASSSSKRLALGAQAELLTLAVNLHCLFPSLPVLRSISAAFAVSLLGLGACQPAPTATTPRQVRSVGYGHVTVYPNYAELTVDAAFTRPRLKDAVAEVQRVVDQLSPYLEQLLATPISGIKDLNYGHSQADSLRREADVLALADAVKTADKMCAALHVKRGAVLEVSDSSSPESSTTSGWGRPSTNIE
nr:hypothetical protein [Tanacetum cinerariifolium]